jgi:hypothetical protein
MTTTTTETSKTGKPLSKAVQARTEQIEAIKELRELLKPGETVYTILRHVSASGMSRVIDLFIMRGNEPRRITWSVAQALGYAYDQKREGLRVSGCGMDMGFHVVYSLARVIFNDRVIYQKKATGQVGSNDAGYLLNQRWM